MGRFIVSLFFGFFITSMLLNDYEIDGDLQTFRIIAIGLTVLFTTIIFVIWGSITNSLKGGSDRKKSLEDEENRRRRQQQDEENRRNQQQNSKNQAEQEEERAFQKQLDRERQTLEMRRGVDLKYSIEERIQNLKITDYNRQRVMEMERELEGASQNKLDALYRELNDLEGR